MNGVPRGLPTVAAFADAVNQAALDELETWPVLHRHLVVRTRPLGPDAEAWRVTMIAVIEEAPEEDEPPSYAIAILTAASDDDPDDHGRIPLHVTYFDQAEVEAINQATRAAWPEDSP